MTVAVGVLVVKARSIFAARLRRAGVRGSRLRHGKTASRSGLKAPKTLRLSDALLDVNLGGQPAYLRAEVLRREGAPLISLIGLEPGLLPPVKPLEGVGLLRGGRAISPSCNRDRTASSSLDRDPWASASGPRRRGERPTRQWKAPDDRARIIRTRA